MLENNEGFKKGDKVFAGDGTVTTVTNVYHNV